ncbi:DUF2993 domain-containing protein [Cyanobacterium aponinum UTEX 3221]|uniref:LmeA family phospholipid-binding protein n=1 Tax=Cyanobacterium aponinum TaxID=379064 RepID=UPI002B4C0EFE|nr:DUF2993 domain-containing protein [Cyanobacterium aponinum]WRL37867.1 DUF2993 domain-containing protein [Cyanobacterium aponinum UTEX 3221]
MAKHKSEIISHILTPAIKLWVRSQLQEIETLNIEIHAGDRQILRGKIEQVFLSAEKANYQGICINHAQVKTEEIAVNLGGILRGKPLKLLHPIFAEGEINLKKKDIQKSLASKLLSQGLIDLLALLLDYKGIKNPESILEKYSFYWQNVTLYTEKVIIEGQIKNQKEELSNINITTGLTLKNDHTLLFNPIEINSILFPEMVIIKEFEVDLGNDVAITDLILNEEELSCQGKIKIVSD